MSEIGARTESEFLADFPIDFRKGVRGDFVRHRNKVVGIIHAHRQRDGAICAGTVYWVKMPDRPKWDLIQAEPLTLAPSIRCSCGLHGWIRQGQWVHAPDSIQ